MNKVLVVFYSNVTKTFSFLRFAVTNKLSTTKYQSFIFNVAKNICFLGITLLDQLARMGLSGGNFSSVFSQLTSTKIGGGLKVYTLVSYLSFRSNSDSLFLWVN